MQPLLDAMNAVGKNPATQRDDASESDACACACAFLLRGGVSIGRKAGSIDKRGREEVFSSSQIEGRD